MVLGPLSKRVDGRAMRWRAMGANLFARGDVKRSHRPQLDFALRCLKSINVHSEISEISEISTSREN